MNAITGRGLGRFLEALRCPRCGGARLEAADMFFDCRICGASYPILAGVPVMCRDAVVAPAPMISPPAAAAVLQAVGLPLDPLNTIRVRAATGTVARFGNGLIETESRQFLDRLRSSGHAIPDSDESPATDPPASGADPVIDPPTGGSGAVRIQWLRDYIPRRLPPGAALTANIRFANTGTVAVPHAGDNPVSMTFRWRGLDGAALAIPDLRTPLPVDVRPGAALTAPIRLQTPAAQGRYLLELIMVHEGVRWLDEDPATIPIRIAAAATFTPDGWTLRETPPASYDEDHRQGRRRLGEWVRDHAPARPRVLEIGGNVSPMIEGLPGSLFNVDVDLLGLQIGAMVTHNRRGTVQNVCADAMELPFASGYFDVIAIFASLHHFPDPAALLAQLRDRLAPGGFIAVLCEPVGHIWPGAVVDEFVRELEKGVNEQSFIVEEYLAIFAAARLVAAEAEVAFDSLKVRLLPNLGDPLDV